MTRKRSGLPSDLRALLERAADALGGSPLAAELREAAAGPLPIAGRSEAVREASIARARLRESQLREAALEEAIRTAIERIDRPDLTDYDPKDLRPHHFRTVSRAAAVLETAIGREPRWKD